MSVKATRPKGRAFQETESSAAEHDVLVDRNVAVPMRDGVSLQADIYRPRTPGRYPVLIERIGYDRTARCAGPGNFFAQHGYVFVGQERARAVRIRRRVRALTR